MAHLAQQNGPTVIPGATKYRLWPLETRMMNEEKENHRINHGKSFQEIFLPFAPSRRRICRGQSVGSPGKKRSFLEDYGV